MMRWEANSQNRTFVVVCLGNHSRNSFYVSSLKKCIYLCIANKDSRENVICEPALNLSTHLNPLC